MSIENLLRESLHDLASDTQPIDGLAAIALRRGRRRQHAARAAIASGAALAAVVPVGLGVLAQTDRATGPSSQEPVSWPTTAIPTASGPRAVPAPSARELTRAELSDAYNGCRQEFFDFYGEKPLEGWEPVFGITLETPVRRTEPAKWVVARRGDGYQVACEFDGLGQSTAVGVGYGVKSTPDLLYALVDGQETGDGAGRYVSPVAQVTVQYDGEPEQNAVMRGGFWFYPMDGMRAIDEEVDSLPMPTEPAEKTDQRLEVADRLYEEHGELIGVPIGYTVRGYDAEGKLVYDSNKDGPSAKNCYADPTGTEFVGSVSGQSDPSECVRTHEWKPLP